VVIGGRIRVLWLIKGLGPGGAERLLVAAAAARDRDQFDCQAVYLLAHKNQLVPELEAVGVRVRCLNSRDERDLRWAATLRSMLVEEPVDIVHMHSPYVAGVARLVVRSTPAAVRPRLVSTEHNELTTFAWPTRLLHMMTSVLDEATIAVSAPVRDALRGPAGRRAEVLIHGIDVEHVRRQRVARAAIRQELGVGPEQLLVGTIANYVRKKDYPNLLHAARLVADRSLDVRFCAVGQGPLERDVRSLRDELALDGLFLLTGYRGDAVRVLAACDVFVLASRFEGLPVALMEAFALGLPVVATAVGGVPDVVEHGVHGLLVPPARPDLLAAAIEELVGDEPRRAAMARAAAAHSSEFDITRAIRRV